MRVAPTPDSFHPLTAIFQIPSESQSSAGRPDEAIKSEASQNRSEKQEQRKPRALVVDDVRDVTEMMAMFLLHAGYEPVMAFTAKEALEAARTEQFDVVVSDISMPEMDGYELAVHLRQLPSYRTIPMIAVTGFSMYDDRGRALQSGFNAHLTKPINPTALLELIERLRD